MNGRNGGAAALISTCTAIFWPGAFIFGFPGVMSQHWQMTFGVGRGAVGLCLFYVLAGVGLFMYLTGRWQEKVGPGKIAALGAFLCGGSALLVGYASSMKMVYLWAFLVGVASAFVYIPALTVVQRWYPHRRGLVSGLVNMAFGLSAAVMSPLFTQMFLRWGFRTMAITAGITALVMGFIASRFVCFPGEKDLPVPLRDSAAPSPIPSLSVVQGLRTPAFWLLWLTWAMAGAAGIAMVTLSTAFGASRGLPIADAVWILTAFNLTNGAGRLVSGFVSDIFGRNATMSAAFVAAGLAYLLLSVLDGLPSWGVLAAVVGFAFGTLFAVSAPLAVDCFGMAHFGAIFGLVFTAYGFVAGPLGPWLSGYVLDATEGNFQAVFTYLGVFFFLSAMLIWFARPPRGVAA